MTSLPMRLPFSTQEELILSSMTVPGEKKYFQEYRVSPQTLFTCVTYFAELLLWLAIKNATASINDSTG